MSVSYKYDAAADALYIKLSDAAITTTEVIDDGTNVDLERHGDVVGIEVLNPARPWPLHWILGRFDISNEDAVMLMTAYPSPAVKVP